MAKYIVQHRRGTAAQWASKDTIIPMEGELVIEIDEESSLHKLKIGDGIHKYSDLPYFNGGNNNIVVSEEAPTVTRETIWLQPLTTDTGAVDYIVESGIIDGDTGYYEKWNSGIVKYYAKITQEITSGNTTYTNTLSIPTTICKKVITHHITAANLSSAKKVEVIGGGVVESGTVLLLYYTLYFEAMAATVETSHTIIGTWK